MFLRKNLNGRQHADGRLQILQAWLVEREHDEQRVIAGSDERLGILADGPTPAAS